MKYSELTDVQKEELIRGGHKFTTEEMSVEDAIGLFNPLKGVMWRSSHLLENIVPQEYMDSKEFFMGIVDKRYPFSVKSTLYYASDRLKMDRELVDMYVKEHQGSAINALIRSVDVNDKATLEELSKDPNVYIVPCKNSDGKIYSYEVKSALLKDEKFVSDMIEKSTGNDGLVSAVLRESELCRINKDLTISCLEKDVNCIYYLDGTLLNNKSTLVEVITVLMEKKAYRDILYNKNKLKVQENKMVKALTKLCVRITELPSNAKLRRAVYEKMADYYLNKLAQEVEAENTSNTTI